MSLFLFLSNSALSQSYDTRFTSSLYSWTESYDGIKRDHLRGYQSSSMIFRDVGVKRLNVKSYFYLTDDFSSDLNTGTTLRIFDLYADYKKTLFSSDIRIGRQFVFAGVGRGPIDGIRLSFNSRENGKLLLYAGTMAPAVNPDNIDSWNESNIFGGELTAYYLLGNVMKFSFVRRSRKVEPFELSFPRFGISSLNPSSLQQQAAGINIARSLSDNMSLYLRGDFGIGEGALDKSVSMDRGEIALTHNKRNSHYLTLELLNRKPLVYVNSFFSNFSSLLRRSNELSVSFDKKTAENLWLNSKIAFVIYGTSSESEGANSLRINSGFKFKSFSSGLIFRNGYGGDWLGLNAGYYGQVMQSLSLRIDGEWSMFSLTSYDLGNDKDESIAFSLRTGINWRFNRHVSLDAEIQSLSQSIEWANISNTVLFAGNDNEFRAFLKLNIWFWKGKGY
ncbi:MAG: hypothetical protein IIB40_01155 [Candidatus Marinimicrobia bacterium]|nr:hypothetical protein [Candidatus Neomarinimicrobiota bacterium]